MSNPYKTREGGATVTVFVPYDCNNHCPFCINKKEYADCTGFSLDAILDSIRTMDAITPRCDFVFTGGEPLANLEALQKMLDAIPTTHKVYINTTFPVQTGFYTAEEMLDFTRRNRDKITCMNVSRHLVKYVEESPDEVLGRSPVPPASIVCCIRSTRRRSSRSMWSGSCPTASPSSSGTTIPRPRRRTCMTGTMTPSCRT